MTERILLAIVSVYIVLQTTVNIWATKEMRK